MDNTTYIISYGIYFNDGSYFSGKMKVKNCMSELHAKIKLEDYLKRKHNNFKQLVVYKCQMDIFRIYDFMKGFGK